MSIRRSSARLRGEPAENQLDANMIPVELIGSKKRSKPMKRAAEPPNSGSQQQLAVGETSIVVTKTKFQQYQCPVLGVETRREQKTKMDCTELESDLIAGNGEPRTKCPRQTLQADSKQHSNGGLITNIADEITTLSHTSSENDCEVVVQLSGESVVQIERSPYRKLSSSSAKPLSYDHTGSTPCASDDSMDGGKFGCALSETLPPSVIRVGSEEGGEYELQFPALDEKDTGFLQQSPKGLLSSFLEEERSLPAKIHNTDSIPVWRAGVDLQMNAYRLELLEQHDSKRHVYQYRLEIYKVIRELEDGKLEEKKIEARPDNDAINQQRRALFWECFQQLLKRHSKLFGDHKHRYCFDCGNTLYSLKKLTLEDNEREQRSEPTHGEPKYSFDIEVDKLSKEVHPYLGRRPLWIRVQLQKVGKVHLHRSNNNVDDHSLAQFFDVLANQELTHRDDFHFFETKLFKKKGRDFQQGNDPSILKKGLQKGVRFMGDSLDSAFAVMQIEPKVSAFFPAVPVFKYLDKLLQGRGRTLAEKIREGNNFQLASEHLRHLVVSSTHLREKRCHFLYGLSADTPTSRRFDYKGEDISVADYFLKHYNLELSYSRDLPCAIAKFHGRESYYPLEVLCIEPGQRIPMQKQSRPLQEAVLRQAALLPDKLMEEVTLAKEDAHLKDGNRYLEQHKVSIASHPISAPGNVLWPPAMTYTQNGGDRDDVMPGKGGELRRNRHFFDPAKAPNVWVAVIFEVDLAGEATSFLEQYVKLANERGLRLQTPTHWDTLDHTDLASLRKVLKKYKKHNVEFVMFFTRDKLDPVHHTMKCLEHEFKIPTQHVSSDIMRKALGGDRGGRGAQMVKNNLMLKTNLKLGGVNYGLAASIAFLERARIQRDIVCNDWFQRGRMFIGLDMTRPSAPRASNPQSRPFDGEPAIVGFSYTLDHPVRQRGTYWYQTPGPTTVARPQLIMHLLMAIDNYKRRVGGFPHHLFVYRGAISDGDFLPVRVEEAEAIKEAFEQLAKKVPDFAIPKLTLMAVQHQNTVKMVPMQIQKGMRPREQNVCAGTCVDRKVLHPKLSEFLLVAHTAIQGTARPIRCTVLYDEAQVSLEELENVSYLLCHAHGTTLSPISRPAPLYSANELVKRGRNDYKEKKDERSRGGATISNGREEHWIVAGDHIGLESCPPCYETKFWA